MVRTDGSDDLLNYGAIPDSPYHTSNDGRIMELSNVSILTESFEDSIHDWLAGIPFIWRSDCRPTNP